MPGELWDLYCAVRCAVYKKRRPLWSEKELLRRFRPDHPGDVFSLYSLAQDYGLMKDVPVMVTVRMVLFEVLF